MCTSSCDSNRSGIKPVTLQHATAVGVLPDLLDVVLDGRVADDLVIIAVLLAKRRSWWWRRVMRSPFLVVGFIARGRGVPLVDALRSLDDLANEDPVTFTFTLGAKLALSQPRRVLQVSC
jgi:hypothetical protein